MFLYVTVSDGKLTAKTEVWVNIVNGSNPVAYSAGANTPGRLRPPFLQLPNFGGRQPPPRLPPPPPMISQQSVSPIFNQPTSTQNVSTTNTAKLSRIILLYRKIVEAEISNLLGGIVHVPNSFKTYTQTNGILTMFSRLLVSKYSIVQVNTNVIYIR